MVLFQFTTNGVLLRPMNITNLLMQQSYILIMAMGMLVVIVTGYVDLSIGSVVAATGAFSAVLMIDNKMSVAAGVVLVLLLGVLIGAGHGFFISVVDIPPFIVTLAGMLIYRGACQVILRGETKARFPEIFRNITTGYLSYKVFNIEIISIILGAAVILFLIYSEFRDRRSKQKYNLVVQPLQFAIAKLAIISAFVVFLTYALSNYNGIPIIFVIVVVLACLYTFILKNTIVGRHIYAVGGNQIAARLSGINVKKIKFIAFTNMGLMSALAGLAFAGRTDSATPRAGVGYELDAIAACYIGGASTSGGIGTIVGGIIGAMVIGILNNGMSIMGMPIDWQNIVKGLVLIAAVCFDLYAKKRSTAA